jgi:hypothetical protein
MAGAVLFVNNDSSPTGSSSSFFNPKSLTNLSGYLVQVVAPFRSIMVRDSPVHELQV